MNSYEERIERFKKRYGQQVARDKVAEPGLRGLTVAQLMQEAKVRGIKGYGAMKKAELIAALEGVEVVDEQN